MPLGRIPTRRAQCSYPGANNLLILVVQPDGKIERHRCGQDLQHAVVRYARETHRMALEARQLESRDPRLAEAFHFIHALVRRDRAIKCHVRHAALRDRLDLGGQPLHRIQRQRIIVGHVDERRHAAGHRGTGGGSETGQAAIARRVGLAVDEARHNKPRARIMQDAALRHRPDTDRRDPLTDSPDPAICDNGVRQNQGAAHDQIEAHP